MNNRSFRDKLKIAANQNLKEKRYWKNKMAGCLVKSSFDWNSKISTANREQRLNILKFSELTFALKEGLHKKLIILSDDVDFKLYIILVTGLTALLYKYTGNHDIIIGTTINKQVEEIDFINTILALKSQIDEHTSFKDLLLQIKQTIFEAIEHQNYPIEVLIEDLNMEFSEGEFPLFDILLILENIQERKYIRNINYNLLFCFRKGDGFLQGTVQYNSVVYDETRINRIIEQYLLLMEKMLANPVEKISGIEILSPEERERVLFDFNDACISYPREKLLHELFEERVEKSPDNTAIIFNDNQVSYAELNMKAEQLSGNLRLLLKPGAIAAIMIGASIEMIIGILGILKAGGAFLPIDAAFPESRIKFILEDSSAEILLTSADLMDLVDYPINKVNLEGQDIYEYNWNNANPGLHSGLVNPAAPLKPLAPDTPAYIIYTSGTTGRPKGVVVEHRNVNAYLHAFYQQFDITLKDVIVQNSSYSFDIFVEELFPILIRGGKIAVPRLYEKEDFSLLYGYISKVGVNILDCTPLLLNELNSLNGRTNIHTYISGGDVLKREYITNLIKPGKVKVYNTYGPTETTICATYYNCVNLTIDDSSIPIGTPIANYKAYILDSGRRLVPIGIPGELCISGPGVTRGYLNDPELTAEKFVISHSSLVISSSKRLSKSTNDHSSSLSPNDQCPMTNDRLYRTGDLAVWRPDGNIDFLGRIDNQVNIRGYRIESKEIESRLLSHKDIKKAVVVERKNDRNNFLCAYYISDREIGKPELQQYLAEELPAYMVPTFFMRLEKIPLTPGGKIDLRELRERDISSGAGHIAPGSELEKILVGIWSEVLEIEKEKISIDDNFFESGGHSLKATILIAKIHRELNIRVPLIEVFRYQTIRELSRYIEEAEEEKFIPIEAVEKKEYYVLSPAQERLYGLQQVHPESTVYNIAFGFDLGENVELERIKKPFLELTARHEVLRSSFETLDDVPIQRIHSEVEVDIEFYKVGSQEAGKAGSSNGKLKELTANFSRPFNLVKAPLMRVGLIETAEKRYLILLDLHRIILDDACTEIVTQELISLYIREELPCIKLHYKDYAEWQRKLLLSKETKEHEEYWLKLYQGNVPLLELKTDFERPEIQDCSGGRLYLEIPENLTSLLRKEIVRHGANINVFLAVFNILLSKLTGQEDIIVGCPVSGRVHIDTQGIIGTFLNLLPLRNRPSGDKTYIEFLQEVKENALQAYNNQDYQFAELIKKIQFIKEPGRHPVIDAVLVVLEQDESAAVRDQNEIILAETTSNKQIEVKEMSNPLLGIKTEYDLEIWISQVRNRIVVTLIYAASIFRKSTSVKMLELYFDILKQVLENEHIMLEDIKMPAKIRARKKPIIRVKKKYRDKPVFQDKWNSKDEEEAVAYDQNLILLRRSKGGKNNLFFVHYGHGEAQVYIDFCECLNIDFNFWGVKAEDRLEKISPCDRSIEYIAGKYIQIIEKVQQSGPYYIVGWSLGGSVAFEIVRQLEECDKEVEFFGLVDTSPPPRTITKKFRKFTLENESNWLMQYIEDDKIVDMTKTVTSVEQFWEVVVKYLLENDMMREKFLNSVLGDIGGAYPNYDKSVIRDYIKYINLVRSYRNSQMLYRPKGKIKTQMYYFEASRTKDIRKIQWSFYCRRPIKCYRIIGDHASIFKQPHVIKFSETFEKVMNNEFNEIDNEYFSIFKSSLFFKFLDVLERIKIRVTSKISDKEIKTRLRRDAD